MVQAILDYCKLLPVTYALLQAYDANKFNVSSNIRQILGFD